MTIAFDNSYTRLPERFYTRQHAEAVVDPQVIALNRELAEDLGIAVEDLTADWLAGNAVPEGAAPLAQVYAGHQFGNFVPQLGDGRALLIGEFVDEDGARFDIQLKGSGRTPYSRMGDGRAAIGPVIREYVMSEAMAALGVPTSRALAAVTTGEHVVREQGPLPGAVLTRVAASHIRVGTFQYFYARGDVDGLRTLADYSIARHDPEADGYVEFLGGVVERQACLVAQWMQLGFIHGVMNTDNCTISGETIDYGPCAFMDGFDPGKVFSSIDQGGRYSWGSQGRIAHWNMAQLAQALLPLLDVDEDKAVELAQGVVDRFPALFQRHHLEGFCAKLGIAEPEAGDAALVEATLEMLAGAGVDHTVFWRHLRGALSDAGPLREVISGEAFDAWFERWEARVRGLAMAEYTMAGANPVRIPRNHQVEAAIEAAERGDYAPFEALNSALTEPYAEDPALLAYEARPEAHEVVHRTFCGT